MQQNPETVVFPSDITVRVGKLKSEDDIAREHREFLEKHKVVRDLFLYIEYFYEYPLTTVRNQCITCLTQFLIVVSPSVILIAGIYMTIDAFPVVALFVQVLLSAYFGVSLLHAINHYSKLTSCAYYRYVQMLFGAMYDGAMFLSCNYVLHTFLWFLMGIILKPLISIPIVINITALTIYMLTVYKAMKQMKRQKNTYENISQREIVVTVFIGMVIFIGICAFLMIGSFAFRSTKNTGYEFIFFSFIPVITSFITRYIQIHNTIVQHHITQHKASDRIDDDYLRE